ncbi:MAG: transposase [Candidatus Thermoplasmatota archaeon]|nr:transposase [Candidatus Thermoplasmatota archaeon]
MNPEILKAAKKIGEERGIPVEVKSMGNSYYLYRDTTRWDKERKKRVKVSEYMGRITEHGLVERNRRTIYEFGNSELLISAASDLIPELKRRFPDHWSEILAMSMIRAEDPRPIKLMKSAWEKLYASTQIDASLSENTISEKLRIIGSDYSAQRRFFQSLTTNGDRILFDLSSIFSRSENIQLAEKGHNPKHMHMDQINFALIFSGKRHRPVILEILPGSVRDYKAFDSIMEQYDIHECIIIADRGLASYEMPRKKGIYLIVAIRRNFDIVDFGMDLDRSFIFNNRGINSGVKDLGGKYLYMYEDTSLRAEEETNMIRKIEIGEKKQKDLTDERDRLGKFAILSNMRSDPKEIYELYKSREEVEVAFDSMKNELENDKSYLHTTDGIRGYFFISFISLYIYFSILETLKEKKLSQKISVKDALFELSKIYVIADGARRSVAEIPDRSQKIADAFGLKLYPKIVRS